MVRFLDLKAQHTAIEDELSDGIGRVFSSSEFILGSEVAAFEEEFAAFCGASHAAGTDSGTSALHLALLAGGIGPGDEVITVPFTFVATVAAIEYTGARPVLVDIEERSFTIDVSRLERAITSRTRAIVPVHLYGQVADMDPIMEIARRRGLLVIEDAAQAHGATYKGRVAGSIGDASIFSFYPAKNLGACGDAGIVVTSNPEMARSVRVLRDWGQESRHVHVRKGFNHRMDGLQAAVLRVKLRHLRAWNDRRRRLAGRYRDQLQEVCSVPEEMPERDHVYHIFAIRTGERDSLRAQLQRDGIETAIHYPTPVHLHPAYANLGYGRGQFPVAEQCASSVLSLPIHPLLTDGDLNAVVLAVQRYAGANRFRRA